MKKINIHKIFIFIIAVITIAMLFLFFKDILIKVIEYQKNNNPDGLKELMSEMGLKGLIIVPLVEAMQMIVVFISAEFIQVSAGLAFPWYIAIPLCLLGIFIGASIIYLLVNSLKFDSSIFKKSTNKIESLSKQGKSTQLFMYILFIMPIIPFGAICYYGSNSKISYRRYILTCVTGTIPSILSSIFLGKLISYILIENIPIWVLIVAIVLVMGLLLLIGGIVISRVYFNEERYTPNSLYYLLLFKVFNFIVKKKVKATYDDISLDNIEGPFVLLSNHPSFYDVYFSSTQIYPKRAAFILNRYYFRYKFMRFFFNQIGTIPKKLFSPDFETIRRTLKTIKSGFPIYMCPEGRLGLDGTNYYSTKETGKFIKQLKLPIVIININGAYISKPKWRKHRIKSTVTVRITKRLSKEEVLTLSVDEINDIINQGITYNEFNYIKENNLTFKDKKKAEGLENVLYHCPKCHQEYTLSSKGNMISCSCGFNLTIKEDYHFEDNEYNLNNIHDWYELIKQEERKHLDNIKLECEVKVKKFNIENKKLDERGSGICKLDNNKFTFEGDLKVKSFSIDLEILRTFAFSCGEQFECYYNDELYYFYPVKNPQQCAKWALIMDEVSQKFEE